MSNPIRFIGYAVALCILVDFLGCYSAATKRSTKDAYQAMEGGDDQKAVAYWEKALRSHLAEGYAVQHPDGVTAAMCAAWLNLKLGNKKGGAEYAAHLSDVVPKKTLKYNWHNSGWELYLVQARAQEEVGHLEQAKALYRKFIPEAKVLESEITRVPPVNQDCGPGCRYTGKSPLFSTACFGKVFGVPDEVRRPNTGGGYSNEQWIALAEKTRKEIYLPIIEHAHKVLSGQATNASNPTGAAKKVECRLNSDCPKAMYCKAGKCVVECRADRDCERGMRCDGEKGQCYREE